jgi:hypothetical protein
MRSWAGFYKKQKRQIGHELALDVFRAALLRCIFKMLRNTVPNPPEDQF